MDGNQLVEKLEQIEEQAKLTLAEYPQHLTKERLRFIIALARFTKSELCGRREAEMLSGDVPGA